MVIGAHYDTKDIPGFVGANDGASGVAVMTQLARTREAAARCGRTVVFVAFDGEESPRRHARRQFDAARPARQPGCGARAARAHGR